MREFVMDHISRIYGMPRNLYRRIYPENIFGINYCFSPLNCTVLECYYDYTIEKLKREDIVLDLGANVGGFSFRVYDKCKFVYSVEPLFTEYLIKNIALNKIKNISVIPEAIGDGKDKKITWFIEKIVKTITFEQLLGKIGGYPDFLKCDIEGAEYLIHPKHLQKIPRLEIEFHKIGSDIFYDYIEQIKKTHLVFWSKTDGIIPDVIGILHGYRNS